MKRQNYSVRGSLLAIFVVCTSLASRAGHAQSITAPDFASSSSSVTIARDQSDSVDKSPRKKCAGILGVWCRLQAHDRKLEQRRHHNPAMCATFRAVGTATGATSGALAAMALAPIFILDNLSARAFDGIFAGSTVLGGVIGYKNQDKEKECKRDPPVKPAAQSRLGPKPPAGSLQL